MTTKPSLSAGYRELLNHCTETATLPPSPTTTLKLTTSVSTNNSPLLRRLQVSRIKHLLSVKSKIFPSVGGIKDGGHSQQHDDDLLLIGPESASARSLPSSPLRKRWLLGKKGDISATISQCNSPSPTHNETRKPPVSRTSSEDHSIQKKLRQRVRSAFHLQRHSVSLVTQRSVHCSDHHDNYSGPDNEAADGDGSESPLLDGEQRINMEHNCRHHIHVSNRLQHHQTPASPLDTEPHTGNHGDKADNGEDWPISYHPIDEIRDVVLARDANKRFGIKLDRTSCGEQITYIVMILPGSVAQKSGLKVGDQIVRVDGFYVHQVEMESLVEYIRAQKESVRVFFKARSLLVRAKVVQIKKEDNKFGLRLIRRIQGVFVDHVIPGSAAEKALLRPGDQLLKINHLDVSHWSQERATQLLKHSGTRSLTLHVYDATFAANDCLHKKNIFFDCTDTSAETQASEEDGEEGEEVVEENREHALDGMEEGGGGVQAKRGGPACLGGVGMSLVSMTTASHSLPNSPLRSFSTNDKASTYI